MYRSLCARFGVSRQDLRVLDWGCGRGRTVLKLLEMGIDAYGVDIDLKPIQNGIPLMRSRGIAPEQRLFHIRDGCLTPFEDHYFHILLSEQVFEHVSDVDALLEEMHRTAMPGGCGFHVFPAKWRVVEPHLHIPFVHWLPKNQLRYWYLYLMINRAAAWKGMDGKSASEKAMVYYNYSVRKTYYRPLYIICRLFNKHGFDVAIQPNGRPSRALKLIMPFLMFDNKASVKLWTLISSNFRSVELVAMRV